MKFRLDYTKKGSKELTEYLCKYMESLEKREKCIFANFSNADNEIKEDDFAIAPLTIKKIETPKRNNLDVTPCNITFKTVEVDAFDEAVEQSEEFSEEVNEVSEASSDVEEIGEALEIEEISYNIEENIEDIPNTQADETSEEIQEMDDNEVIEAAQKEVEPEDAQNDEITEDSDETLYGVEADEIEDKTVENVNRVPRRPASINKLAENNTKKKKGKKSATENENKNKITVSIIFKRIGISLGSFVALLLVFALTLNFILLYGPSKSIRNIYVNSVTETSAMKFLAYWFMDDDLVEEIIEDSRPKDDGAITDSSIIEFPNYSDSNGDEVDINSIELVDVQGKTYKGKMLIIQNPKRVYLGTPEAYGKDKEGLTTINMVKEANALYGVNGGGFYDTGAGNGGIPTGRGNSSGIVISKGKLMWGSLHNEYEIIGINKQGVLVLGKMTGQEALDSGIVEALNFGPYLIKDGVPCEISDGSHGLGGLNPRTAIGQRKDGSILLLTIDGRQASGLGASYKDLIEVMMSFDAVNAANLDGGSSTYMVQNSETENNPKIITQCASLYGPRQVATSILVSRVDQINEQYE